MIVFAQVTPNVKPTESENELEDIAVEDTPSKKSETKKKVYRVLIIIHRMKFFESIVR